MADGIVRYIIELTDKTKAGIASATRGARTLERQTDEAAEAVDHLGDESAQTGRQVATMGRQASKASTGTAALGKGARGATSRLAAAKSAAASFGAALAALGLARVAAEFVGLSQQVADYRNDIGDAATRSGLAAETIQGLRLAAEGAGLTFEALAPGLDQFAARLSQASTGTGRTAEAFAALGVAVTDADGGLRNADDVFRETVAALNAMEPGAQRSALAVEALGRSGGKLLQALSGGELDNFVEQARLFGIDIGPRAAQEAGNWQRASADLALVLRGLKGDIVDAFGVGAEELYRFTDVLVVTVEAVRVYAERLPAVFQAVADAIGEAFAVLPTQFDRIIARLEALGTVASALVEGDLNAIGEAVRGAEAGIGAADAAFDQQARARDASFARVSELLEAASEAAAAAGGAILLARQDTRAGAATPGGGGVGLPPAAAGASAAAQAAAGGTTTLSRADLAAVAAAAAGGVQTIGRGAGGAVDPGAAAANREFLEDALRETRMAIATSVQNAAGISQSALSGNVGGALAQTGRALGGSAVASLGAAGAVIGAVQFIGEQGADGIRSTLDGLKDSLLAGIKELPELIGEVLPDFAVALVRDLIPALIKASPKIWRALIIELPLALAEAIVDALTPGGGPATGRVSASTREELEEVQDFLTSGTSVGSDELLALAGEEQDRQAGRQAGRATAAGRSGYGRAEDRLAMSSTRPRRRPSVPVAANPFDEFSRQFSVQAGDYGRYSSRIGGVS